MGTGNYSDGFKAQCSTSDHGEGVSGSGGFSAVRCSHAFCMQLDEAVWRTGVQGWDAAQPTPKNLQTGGPT